MTIPSYKVQSLPWEDLHIFFHPDYTVGFGVSPNQPPGKLRTNGQEQIAEKFQLQKGVVLQE